MAVSIKNISFVAIPGDVYPTKPASVTLGVRCDIGDEFYRRIIKIKVLVILLSGNLLGNAYGFD